MSDIKVIGSYISPYVRKVLVFLETKGIGYEIDPIAPFVGNEEFARLSPLKRVPVLIDGRLVLNDSSVICQYLEDKFPEPSLYPRDIADRARVRWLEEFADTRLADGLIWRLFYELSIRSARPVSPPMQPCCSAHARWKFRRHWIIWKRKFRRKVSSSPSRRLRTSASPAISAPRNSCVTKSTRCVGRASRHCWIAPGRCGHSARSRASRNARCACRLRNNAMPCAPRAPR